MTSNPAENKENIDWKISLFTGITLTLIYSANLREIECGDTAAAKFLSMAIIRGDGLYLDRFRQQLHVKEGGLTYSARESHGHIVSTYPVGPALIAVPLVAP